MTLAFSCFLSVIEDLVMVEALDKTEGRTPRAESRS